MADAILLFPPGFSVTNTSDDPVNGAVLRFYDAGTSNARTVYSNPSLTTSLGTSVTCNAAGRPASGGNEVLVYASEGNLKVTAETSAAVSVWSYDNVIGALDTTTFSANTAIPETPVLTKTADYTITTSDVGRMVNFNSTSNLTASLPSAVTAGDGFLIGIRAINTGAVIIDASGSQTIDGEAAVVLKNRYEMVWLVSDAANWHIISHSTPLRTGRLPVLTVRNRTTTSSPASATDGDRYIIMGTGGDWSTFAANQIAEKDGIGTWIDYTPAEGWLAWVQDENRYVQYNGTAWTSIQGQLLATEGSVSAASGIPINLGQFTWAKGFVIEVYGALPSADAATLSAIFATDGANTFIGTGTYNYARQHNTEGTVGDAGSGGQSRIDLAALVGSAANEGANVTIKLMNPFSNAFWPRITWEGSFIDNQATPGFRHVNGGGSKETASQVNGIRIAFSTEGVGGTASVNITASYVVYGLL